ncbi:MAG: hypothetical protein Q7S86_04485 [bacterium]|nr:hypothetical protein [bacterium]
MVFNTVKHRLYIPVLHPAVGHYFVPQVVENCLRKIKADTISRRKRTDVGLSLDFDGAALAHPHRLEDVEVQNARLPVSRGKRNWRLATIFGTAIQIGVERK